MPEALSPLPSRRWQTPSDNHAILTDPPLDAIGPILQENIKKRRHGNFDVLGRSYSSLVGQARAELLDAARNWTSRYRPLTDDEKTASSDGPILVGGHQPQLFHPGVWIKNAALARLALKNRAAAVHLIVDSDTASPTSIFTPRGNVAEPEKGSISFDAAQPAIPFEERRVQDRLLFENFPSTIENVLKPFFADPLIKTFWPAVLEATQKDDRWGYAFAQARNQFEAAWGYPILNVPQSAICDLPAFCLFALYLFSHAEKFASQYNAAVHAYRKSQKIRNQAHPVPDLAVDGDQIETPFWIWTEKNPSRRRLWVQKNAESLILSDGGDFRSPIPLPTEGNVDAPLAALTDLRRQGAKIRSRALITTLWARLFLGDFFIHGIGGGNYDRVTDTLIAGFFKIDPPRYAVLSGTLHLPIERFKTDRPDLLKIKKELRELTYHPETFLEKQNALSEEVQRGIAEKRKWIAVSPTVENAKRRCQAIRDVNERLQPEIESHRRDLERRLASTREENRIDGILASREYALCLFPEKILREFFNALDIRL